jgi:ribosome biogenesis GTPase
LNLKVGEISDATQKGIHTTTSVRMYPLSSGGYVVDTPGLRYLGLWDLEMSDLWRHFPEIEARARDCRFRNCRHIAEPGCAVKAAVENGDIFAERYESYLKIFEEGDIFAERYESYLKIFEELQTNAF